MHTGNDVAALDGERVSRGQRASCFEVGQLLEPNRLVRLGSGAQRAGGTAEDVSPVADECDGSHVLVNRASADLADRSTRPGQSQARVAQAQRQREHEAQSENLLFASHRTAPLSPSYRRTVGPTSTRPRRPCRDGRNSGAGSAEVDEIGQFAGLKPPAPEASCYFESLMDSTRMVFVLSSSAPRTATLCAANFPGVC